MMQSAYDIILNIMVTEKSTLLKDANQYAFKVDPRATKLEVASAIEKLYGAKVKSVNMVNYKGKPKRAGKTPTVGHRSRWKKAIVTLAEGSIELV